MNSITKIAGAALLCLTLLAPVAVKAQTSGNPYDDGFFYGYQYLSTYGDNNYNSQMNTMCAYYFGPLTADWSACKNGANDAYDIWSANNGGDIWCQLFGWC